MSSIAGKRRVRTITVTACKNIFERANECMANFSQDSNSFEELSSFKEVLIEKYNKVKAIDDDLINLIEDDEELLNEENLANDINESQSSSLKSFSNNNIKLPPLKLSTFTGKPEEWQTFYENFECAIHNNNDLSPIQKLNYLRNLLDGKALKTISGLALTNDNYHTSLELLKERFNDKQLLISTHMKSLLSLERVQSINNISLLRRIHDNIEVQIRSLENLGIDSTMYGPLLIPIIMQKIPEELNLIIARNFDSCDYWDIKYVLKSLKAELQAREKAHSGRECNFDPSTAEVLHSSASFKPQYELKCIFCSKSHKSESCKTVTNINSRRNVLRDKRRCFNCLKSGHMSKDCRSRISCYECSGKHHVSMCFKRFPLHIDDSKEPNNKLTSVATTEALKSKNVLLQTAMVTVKNKDKTLRCRLLFDSCSQLSYISPSLRKKLFLPTLGRKQLNIKTFGNQSQTQNLEMVKLSILTLKNSLIPITCFVKPICAPLSGQYIEEAVDSFEHLKGINLADSNVDCKSLEVDVLIGADYYWSFFNGKVIRANKGPVALQSSVDCRYTVKLPFKNNHALLSDNYSLCIKRLNVTLNKLKNDSELLNEYNKIIIEQLNSGVIEKVNNYDWSIGEVHYLPHRPVCRKDKTSTKVRIVFDASSTLSGPSLNDCINAGPSLATPLFFILLRFRANKYAFIADIEKAFLQIALDKNDRNYLRLIWFDDIYNINNSNLFSSALATYRICRVPFGVTSSPFLLNATLIYHTERYCLNDNISSKLLQSLHIDDLISSCVTIEEGILFFNKCKDILKEGGFNLRKFESNSSAFEKQINGDNYERQTNTRVLGLKWNKTEDSIIYSFEDLLNVASIVPTKREVMSFIASIYDPIGLINPVVVTCKNLFQRICVSKLGWNENLYGDLLSTWNLILSDFKSVFQIAVPRWYMSPGLGNINNVKFELHGFSDASVKSFGCCVYLRFFNANFSRASLIASKSRVAPLGKNTMPRLELSATLLLAKLLASIYDQLISIYNISNIVYWTDSTICLHWIFNTNNTYEQFVQNRLNKIRELTLICNWNYIESFRNPADIISRGSSLKKLNNNELWFYGPNFLNDINIKWPYYEHVNHSNETHEVLCNVVHVKVNVNLDFINVDKFSDFRYLLRVTSWILRFINNAKDKKKNIFKTGLITAEEIDNLVKHNGVKETINALRSQYWIPCCRQLAKSVIRECTTCRRIEGRPYSYPPAPPLPESRLNSDFAFKSIALDYAGPLYIKDIYGDCTLNKAWIFLLTCCSSRSILLDLVADCSSRSCIMGIRRFIGRRGVPEIIYSDNGSQFFQLKLSTLLQTIL
nr:uncharacterized protein LOC124809364 [Hydra vulgaris]